MQTEKKTSLLMAFTNPLPGKEDEYNEWYDNIHLKEVTAVDGFISGRRFKLADTQMGGANHKYKYLVIYEFETGKSEAILKNLAAAMPTMRIAPVIDPTDTVAYSVESICDTARKQ